MVISKTVRIILILVVVVIVLLGLGVGLYFLLRKNPQSSPVILPIYPNPFPFYPPISPLVPPPPFPITNLKTSLPTNAALTQGDKLWDASGTFYLTPQPDGNLVLYDYRGFPNSYWSCCGNKIPWSSNPPFNLLNQGDGNIVLYDSTPQPDTPKVGFQTSTNTAANKVYPLVLVIKTFADSSGKLLPKLQVIDNNGNGKVLWSSS